MIISKRITKLQIEFNFYNLKIQVFQENTKFKNLTEFEYFYD